MCSDIHTPCMLHWLAVVSVLLMFQLTITVNKFYYHNHLLYLCLYNLIFSVGTVFAFISNEKLNDSIQNFNNTVNTAIDNSLDFVLDTQIVSCI